jgi:hypothetical protein
MVKSLWGQENSDYGPLSLRRRWVRRKADGRRVFDAEFKRSTGLYAHELGLVPITTPAYSPESNGLAEAFVGTFKRDYLSDAGSRDAESVLAQLGGWIADYNTRRRTRRSGCRARPSTGRRHFKLSRWAVKWGSRPRVRAHRSGIWTSQPFPLGFPPLPARLPECPKRVSPAKNPQSYQPRTV